MSTERHRTAPNAAAGPARDGGTEAQDGIGLRGVGEDGRTGRAARRRSESGRALSRGAVRRRRRLRRQVIGGGLVAACVAGGGLWCFASADPGSRAEADTVAQASAAPAAHRPTPGTESGASATASPSASASPSRPAAKKKPKPSASPRATKRTPAPKKKPRPTQRPTQRPTSKPSVPPGPSDTASRVIALVNKERAAAGCGPVTADKQLAAAARGHSGDMAARNFFDHTNPDGAGPGERITAAGYRWSTYGENIARGQQTPESVMDAWMHSPGHRANILNCSFKNLGVGVHQGSGGPWWTQNFGARM